MNEDITVLVWALLLGVAAVWAAFILAGNSSERVPNRWARYSNLTFGVALMVGAFLSYLPLGVTVE